MVKYVVIPGKILSRNDEDIHFIDAPTLMRLYKVDPDECIVKHNDERDRYHNFDGLIELRPSYRGNYELPKK